MEQVLPIPSPIEAAPRVCSVARPIAIVAAAVLVVALAATTIIQVVDRSHLHARLDAVRVQLATTKVSLTSGNQQIASLQGQVSGLQVQLAGKDQAIAACQRTAGVVADAWQLTNQARRWTKFAVIAAAWGDYVLAGVDLKQANTLARQANAEIGGTGSDIQVCANSGGATVGV